MTAVARNPRDRKRMAVLATGRRALTHVEPIARFDVCDLVRISLGTGRTHQNGSIAFNGKGNAIRYQDVLIKENIPLPDSILHKNFTVRIKWKKQE